MGVSLLEWSIAVFARNEQARISDCLRALDEATCGTSCHVTVIVNGSSDRTALMAQKSLPDLKTPASVYEVQYGCKSNAMNLFIHQLRPAARFYAFVDAAAFVGPHALQAMANALETRPDMTAVSGLPQTGRTAHLMRQSTLEGAKLFGQMFAVRADFLDALVRLGRQIPIGVYRCDGLFAGYIEHETDGVAHPTPVRRVMNVPEATWRTRPISYFSPRDLKKGFDRLVRQQRGRLENQAWNTILWSRGFGALPRFAELMILEWLQRNNPRPTVLKDRIFMWQALKQIRNWRQPSEQDLQPVLVAETAR